jgi:hypothetical protein
MAFYPAVATAGNTPLPLPVTDGGTGATTAAAALTALGGLVNQATTGVAGFTLQNATPTILSWTVPNDGNIHRCTLIGELIVSSAQTGGSVVLNFNDPGGSSRAQSAWGGGLGAGFNRIQSGMWFAVGPGQTVTVTQTAQTAGAAILYAELWGS